MKTTLNDDTVRLCGNWKRLLKSALAYKQEHFTRYGDEIMRYFDADSAETWKSASSSNDLGSAFELSGHPECRLHMNRCFDAVSLIAPLLFQIAPAALVTPIERPLLPPDVMGLDLQNPNHAILYQQYRMSEDAGGRKKKLLAKLNNHYLDWVQRETDKVEQFQLAAVETVLKGMGILWSDVYSPPGASIKYTYSQFVSVDNFVQDHNVQHMNDTRWIARRRVQPVVDVERKFGYQPGVLRGSIQSQSSQSSITGLSDRREKRDTGSYDLIEYWEVYSKCGLLCESVSPEDATMREGESPYNYFGENVYLAICDDYQYPLNMPKALIDSQDFDAIRSKVQWSSPYWADPLADGGWPCSRLFFHKDPNSVYPISMLKPGLPELRFISWAFSHLADRVGSAGKTVVGVPESYRQRFVDQLEDQQGSVAFVGVGIDDHESGHVSKMFDSYQIPGVGQDIWNLINAAIGEFERRTGLSDLAYGESPVSFRSAAESQFKESQYKVRPQHMSNQADAFMSNVVRKEALAAIWSLDVEDVTPILGEHGARLFVQQIENFESVIRDNSFTIEAGSVRRPDIANQRRAFAEFTERALPVADALLRSGDPTIWNAMAKQFGKMNQIDVSEFLMEPPLVPPPPHG